jgi:hypothetical protein
MIQLSMSVADQQRRDLGVPWQERERATSGAKLANNEAILPLLKPEPGLEIFRDDSSLRVLEDQQLGLSCL